ncbi:DNA repair helicase XPB [Paenibacillus sp. MMS20-IR301]|uniref:DNA repair helicase XPB n=1 Tax=Paenibacillus sp. MMS20-IR301 TaxID=2895946 RepID=UPI0028F0B43C|nr:DNA repair helicase XPB [Paenibacillus sp. MMS20-IR301]WNS45774.1 helicase-associated domain-containing protein [Paenibacillus sp. MMS20-IR301]
MKGAETGACITRSDRTILLECAHPGYEAARAALADFAELLKSPPAYHTYRITPLSLWNAAARGHTPEAVIDTLRGLSRWGIPSGLEGEITLLMSRYGLLQLCRHESNPLLVTLSAAQAGLLDELELLEGSRSLRELGLHRAGPVESHCPKANRGLLKQELTRMGYPVLDYAGYRDGQELKLALREADEAGEDHAGAEFGLRAYQQEAVSRFQGISGTGGSGVVVLPCGAGKTVVGLAVLEKLQCETLILTSSTTSVEQWRAELLQRTTLLPEEVGEYTGENREVRPVTVATYQMLTHRSAKGGPFLHMSLFNERNWGLIIYDEVHLLPAPVFRATADIQATRRLGLTATLVREDGREGDVFSLIGPKCYDLPWKVLEQQGFIAAVDCIEVIVPMNQRLRQQYLYAGAKEQFRLAAGNQAKAAAAAQIAAAHPGAAVLVIGQYLDQLQQLAEQLDAPLITGKTPHKERSALYAAFNEGRLPLLIVSKVANFAVNLPDASVAVEVSGAFGSRQEEAQRLGRILRPKPGDNKAYFYTLVSGESRELDFALRRRMFLTEQGYEYAVRQLEPPEEAVL